MNPLSFSKEQKLSSSIAWSTVKVSSKHMGDGKKNISSIDKGDNGNRELLLGTNEMISPCEKLLLCMLACLCLILILEPNVIDSESTRTVRGMICIINLDTLVCL